MFEQGCITPLISTDVTLGPSPNFELLGSETNVLGYSVDLCYGCTVLNGDGTLSNFKKDQILISAYPYDCSAALMNKAVSDKIIPYDENDAVGFSTAISSYSEVFTH